MTQVAPCAASSCAMAHAMESSDATPKMSARLPARVLSAIAAPTVLRLEAFPFRGEARPRAPSRAEARFWALVSRGAGQNRHGVPRLARRGAARPVVTHEDPDRRRPAP